MARPASSQPTDVELRILRVLWERGPSTIRQIHDVLSADRPVLYATTVKMLVVMHGKGLVRRDNRVRPQIYRAALSRKTAQRLLLGDVIRKVYDGSAGSLVLHALSSERATPEELRAIRELLDELEEGEKQ